jgi:hypothetical protein
MDNRSEVATMRDEDAEHADEKKHEANCTEHRATPVKVKPGGWTAEEYVKLCLRST